jgi:glycosyltransferase involved in cell wall biosynthesis
MNQPLVSIITAFLNAERFLQDAIESVLAQSYPHWELILVDDGSTDGSSAMARRYAEQHPEHLFYLQHPHHENRGAAASRNVGVRAARGEHVAILDADDVWLPNKLERQVAILGAEPRAAMVCGASLYWHSWAGESEGIERDVVTDLGIESGRLYEPPDLLTLIYPLGDGGAPCPSNILLRRRLMDPDGGFHEDFRGPFQLYEDQVFLTKIYLTQPVFVTNEVWDKYRIHPDSCVSTVTAAGKYDAVRTFFLDWLDRHLREQGMKHSPAWTALQKALSVYRPVVTITGRVALRKQWALRAADGNVADLIVSSGDSDTLRIAIDKATTSNNYDIQLNQPRLKLKALGRYSLRFSARADRPRSIGVGCAKAGKPWTNLGLYARVDLTQEWQQFQEEFDSVADEGNARIHFDLGECDAAVELRSITLSDIDEHHTSTEGSPAVQSGDAVRPSSGADAMTPVSSDWGWDRGLPIDRHYIERFLSSHAEDIRGCVLEISDDWYTRKFGGGRPTSTDILDISKENPRATVIADLTHADQIPSNSFDCIIMPQTFQFIYDVRSAIVSLHRILKRHGVLLATLPALTRTRSDDPSGPWYWSFTHSSVRRLAEEVFLSESIETRTYGNLVTAVSFLRGLASEELSQEDLEYCDADFQILVCLRAVKP